MALYEVVRPYPGGPDGMRRTGDIVDSDRIRPSNLNGLIRSRHLRLYEAPEGTEAAETESSPATDAPTSTRRRRVVATPEA